MSKVQYLLLAAFVGFYALLFTMLIVRAFMEVIRARMKSIRPGVVSASRSVKMKAGRPWTAAVWRNA
jgi:F0F1-type ATP synthase membrane subunit b/b'